MPTSLEVLPIREIQSFFLIYSNYVGNLIFIKKKKSAMFLETKWLFTFVEVALHLFLNISLSFWTWRRNSMVWRMWLIKHHCHWHPSSEGERQWTVCLQQINREGCFCLSDWSRTIYSSVTLKERLVDLRALLLYLQVEDDRCSRHGDKLQPVRLQYTK